MLKKLFFGLLIIVGLSDCTTSSVLVNIQRPSDIIVPEDVRNIVVVNRSRPSKDNLAGSIVEDLISGEEIDVDRKGAVYCVDGLVNMLTNSERFTLNNIGSIELKETDTSAFPIPLDWNEVKSICGSYDSDALLVLETFGSDSRVRIGVPDTNIRTEKGIKIKELRYPAILTISIESGWRIYDVNKKHIIDENKFTEIKEFSAWGNNPKEAELNLPSKRLAIKQSGVYAGEQYGFRIASIWIKVNRNYYVAKHDDLKLAKQYVKSGDWDTAIELWKPITEDEDSKIAGMSAYNMALASEVKGSLDDALDWAKKAQKLGEKKAYSYIDILQKRKMDEEKLKQQLNN